MVHCWNLLDRRVYKRTCDATGKEIFSMYPAATVFPVYGQKHWFSDAWDAGDYAQDYNWSKPFFQQWFELRQRVPRYATWNVNSENCDYCTGSRNSKDCYYGTGLGNEHTLYASAIDSSDVVDSWLAVKSQLIYESFFTTESYHVSFAEYITKTTDSAFVSDALDCSNCFGCYNIRNKQYYIFNQPYSAAEYTQKLTEFDLGAADQLACVRQRFKDWKLQQPHSFSRMTQSENCTGNDVHHSSNCFYAFSTYGSQDCKYITLGLYLSDSYDGHDIGSQSSLMYECLKSGINGYNIQFSMNVLESHDVQYSDLLQNCSDMFGCVGVRNKQYCILNKQYTKTEYQQLVPKIIQHMDDMPYVDSQGVEYRFGEFAPVELSIFAFNDTDAWPHHPYTKQEAQQHRLQWRDAALPKFMPTLQACDLPNHITDVTDALTKQVIACDHAGRCNDQCLQVYQIIPHELAFYRKMGLALPRLCPQCRYMERVRQTNPLKLWQRSCMCPGKAAHGHGITACAVQFETVYHPDRPEIVYCKECYTAELV